MGFDAIFKRYFAAVVCLLVGVAAYFQAAGMGQLVASTVALEPSAIPSATPRAAPRGTPAPAGTEHATNAAAILSRNPFDSVTGPLDGKQIELPEAAPQKEETNRDPYDDPDCDVAKVLLIVASDDPQWSFAALAGSDGRSQLRRVGDEIGGYTVFHIGDLRTEEQRKTGKREIFDRVWLQSGTGSRCQLRVGGKAPTKSASPAPSEAPAEKPKKKGSKVPAEIADKIHKVSETEFNVERSVISSILENQAELMKSARIVPEKEGDKVVGIRLFGIRPDSLLGTLGLENGDRLSSINGFEMSDPQKALEAYSKLQTADHLTVAVNRHGKPVNIDFNIK